MPALQFMARCRCLSPTGAMIINAGMLRERFNYYCEKVVKGFKTTSRVDRRSGSPGNHQHGPLVFNDMSGADAAGCSSTTGRIVWRLFSPIDKSLSPPADPCDHRSARQYGSPLQQLIQDAQCGSKDGGSPGAGVCSGDHRREFIDANGEKLALRGNRLMMAHRLPFILAVPARLPGQAFWG